MILFRTIFLAVLFVGMAITAQAQTAQVAFGGLKQDTTLPVEITADALRIDQENGTAVFTGNVIVGQGEMRLSAAMVRVEYATQDGESTGKVDKIYASGGVTFVNGVEAAEAEDAVYSVAEGTIVMTGNVILTQGQNVLSGDTLFVNLETGIGTMDGRVRSIFLPEEK